MNLPPRLYINNEGYGIHRKSVDYRRSEHIATSFNNVVVFTSRNEFDYLSWLEANYSILITNKDKSVVFYSNDNKIKLSLKPGFFGVSTKICSQKDEVCVLTSNARGGLLSLSILESVVLSLFLIALLTYIYVSLLNVEAQRKGIDFRLKKAISNMDIYILYQPIVSLPANKISGVEALARWPAGPLARWHDGVMGNVPPDLFIGIAKQSGLYKKLTALIFNKAINELAPCLQKDRCLTLSLNICEHEITDGEFIPALKDICLQNDILFEQLKLEVSETTSLETQIINDFATKAKQQGFMIAIDDFGTGYSNISWVTEIAADEIKIDRVITSGVIDNYKSDILKSLVFSLQKSGRRLVFEGVEKKAQLQSILAICESPFIQGWYLYKPVRIDELPGILSLNDSNGEPSERFTASAVT
ncbi:PAS/PAC sensor-containing diguanylate cyclase/phosphodiesterase [Klebsiella variicola]|nr:PAS/PAC sensor-containing diguanylate cyclase/phosphodiesterase [Klebsiella variicola]